MKNLLLILESRASYGYSKNLINLIKKNNYNINYKTFVTGTHLSNELGSSIDDLKKDKIKINYKLNFNKNNIVNGISHITKYTKKILDKNNFDLVLIFGDRIELLGIALAATYSNIAIGHVQAGDRSGHFDDLTRMTLAKLCHLHFPATKLAAKRLIKLGEQKFRIYKIGAPQLDEINYSSLKKIKEINFKNKIINLKEKYIILLQHSVFKDKDSYNHLFELSLKACLSFNLKIYVIYPNYDPGYKFIIKLIKKYKLKYKNKLFVIKHLMRKDFLALMTHSQSLVGNSSAGILESPSLKTPVVNIGDRQSYREQNENIFNANYNIKDIKQKINLSLKYKKKILNKRITNIHGDGKSSQRLLKIINKINLSKKLLNKDTTY